MSHDKPISILIVEDEALIRFAMAEELSDQGYRVFEAANADEAIAFLEAEPSIQIMFTDVDMPGSMDGLKLSAAVRNRWPPVKIVVTSGKRLVEITDLPDGGVFFAKPYVYDQVIASFSNSLEWELNARPGRRSL
jgi:two-component system, response regulator PdtaR